MALISSFTVAFCFVLFVFYFRDCVTFFSTNAIGIYHNHRDFNNTLINAFVFKDTNTFINVLLNVFVFKDTVDIKQSNACSS